MSYTALDYSTPIKGADLAAATVDGIHKIDTVFRYITPPDWPKSLQQDEYTDLRAHGFTVHLLDEGTDDYMVTGSYAGFAGGATRARERRARANQIGATGRIFYSLDIGATQAEIDIALEFLAGAHSVDPAGVAAYGEYDFVRQAADSGYPIFGTEGWSKGQRDPRAVAWQLARQITVAGVTCDVVDLNPSTAPSTAPSASTPEDDMPIFSEGRITSGENAVTVICVPPANNGAAGWGNVWFSLGTDFGDAHVRVALYVHGVGWTDFKEDLVVPSDSDRVQPFGNALPDNVQKISVTRRDNPEVPLSYMIEATAR